MKYLPFLRVFCVFLVLVINGFLSVSGAEEKLDISKACNLKSGQEFCSKLEIDINENERNSCVVSLDSRGRAGVNHNQNVSRCTPIDRRFEFLILFLQIMRGAK